MRKHIFNAGPAVLPTDVLKQASDSVIEFGSLGQSILEISHRSKDFIAVVDETTSLLKELLSLDDDFEIVFSSRWCKLTILHDSIQFLR